MAGCSAPWRARTARVLALSLLLLFLSACAAPTSTPEPVTVRFAFLDVDAAYYQPLAEKFGQEHPNIIIQLVPRNGQQLSELRPEDADVFVTQSIHARQEKGELLSLDPWLSQDKSFAPGQFYPGTLQIFQRDGKTWGLPLSVDPIIMFYNKDLFNLYKVPTPQPGWTWDEFLATARALRHKDEGVYGYAAYPECADCLFFIYEHGGRVLDDLQNPVHTTFDDPKTIEAMEWYARLITEFDVAADPDRAYEIFGGGSQYAVYYGIYGSKIGLWIGALSEQGGRYWPRPWEFKWGMTTLPRDARNLTAASVSGLAIFAQSQHPEAGWQWIDFLSRQMPGQYVPARIALAESPAYEQLVGPQAAAVVRAAMAGEVIIAEPEGDFSAAMTAFQQAMKDVLAGRAEVAGALRKVQQEAGQ